MEVEVVMEVAVAEEMNMTAMGRAPPVEMEIDTGMRTAAGTMVMMGTGIVMMGMEERVVIDMTSMRVVPQVIGTVTEAMMMMIVILGERIVL